MEQENMKSIIVSMVAAVGLIIAGSALAADMPESAKKHGCVACHKIDTKLVGPAWMDVSKAYNKVGATGSAVNPMYKVSKTVADILAENKAKTAEEWLIQKVSKGGKGNWGAIPMTPNAPKVSEADIKELITFILALAK